MFCFFYFLFWFVFHILVLSRRICLFELQIWIVSNKLPIVFFFLLFLQISWWLYMSLDFLFAPNTSHLTGLGSADVGHYVTFTAGSGEIWIQLHCSRWQNGVHQTQRALHPGSQDQWNLVARSETRDGQAFFHSSYVCDRASTWNKPNSTGPSRRV